MRATGRRLGNPAAEQAEGPPTNPVGLPDNRLRGVPRGAAAVPCPVRSEYGAHRRSPSSGLRDVEQACNQPGPTSRERSDAGPSHGVGSRPCRRHLRSDGSSLSPADEASAEVTPFTSKFDAVLGGQGCSSRRQEQAGYALFRGKAQCNNCHRDGGPGERSAIHRFHRQYRNARKTADAGVDKC